MNFAGNYFSRYDTKPKIFAEEPGSDLDAIVVIPCYDDPAVFETLDSLEKAMDNNFKLEVIVVVNSGEHSPAIVIENNRHIFAELEILKDSGKFSFKLLPVNFENTARKISGVGNARKIGMDEAVRRFDEINKPNGIIISLDADCIVGNNYFELIIDQFKSKPGCGVSVFQFRHNFDKETYPQEVIDACKLYEIYLRYFRRSLLITGFPYCFHTIGSCFAVNAITYTKAGGMSKRQGGEDFYFLHKSVQATQVCEIKIPVVFPSPRISGRVPFGTGPSVQNIINSGNYKVYNFDLFFILKRFFECFNDFTLSGNITTHNIPAEIIDYAGEDNIKQIIMECTKNSRYNYSFVKRLYSKFDAFFIIKFLNSFGEDSKYPPVDVLEAGSSLLKYHMIFFEDSPEGIYNEILKLDLE